MNRRGRSRLALGIYVAGVVVAAAIALGWGLLHLERAPHAWVLVLFAGLALVLELMVVPLAGGGGAAASFAAYFAGLLVLGPVPTAGVAAAVAVFADGVVRRARVVRAGFNASHGALSLLATGWIYQQLGGTAEGLVLQKHWPAVIAAGICLWMLETGWVAAAVALDRGVRVVGWLRSSLAPMLQLDAALASVGLLLALLYQSRERLAGTAGWQGTVLLAVIAVILSWLLYYAYRLQGHVHEVYAKSLRALGTLVEAKVEAAQPGHSGRVADLAATLAEALEMPAREVEQVRYAGFLHDIGKVGVPSSTLARSRDQFAGEAQAVRLHPEIGEQILAPVRFLEAAARMVRSHHERWDGLGYPDRLRNREIPLGARLLAIADAHVSMTEALAPDEALSRLSQAAGSRFDPKLVEALERVTQDGEQRHRAAAL